MNPTNILRALLLLSLFGASIILLGGFVTRLGGKAGGALKCAI